MERTTRAQGLVLVAPLVLGAALVTMRISPPGSGLPYPPCPLLATTGLYCPGCGSTRALLALVEGDPLLMVRQNPLVVAALLVLAAVWVRTMARTPRGRRVLARTGAIGERLSAPPAAHPALVALTGAVILAFGVARNLPWFPLLVPLPL